MSVGTAIEWTDATWNPTTGCTRVSAGCEHCYIERTPPMRVDRRFEGPEIGASTKGGVQLHPDRLDQPLHWRKPRRVFVNSMSDLFHPDVPDGFIAGVFQTMHRTPQHSYQVLTKRPRRMRDLLTKWDVNTLLPLPNVWLGTSVENQEWADKRIPLLLETPAAVRFLSCEPLLGPIDLDYYFGPSHRYANGRRPVDWVIVGGESGPGARPMHPDWARSLRDQCVAAGVPFFFKQWGNWRWTQEACDRDYEREHGDLFPNAKWEVVRADGSIDESNIPKPGTTVMQHVGKHKAGRELDGRSWDEMPSSEMAVAQ